MGKKGDKEKSREQKKIGKRSEPSGSLGKEFSPVLCCFQPIFCAFVLLLVQGKTNIYGDWRSNKQS